MHKPTCNVTFLCSAFEKAEDAVKAAVDALINFANKKWDDLRIRIGFIR